MDIAKLLFRDRDHEGYVGKEGPTRRELEEAVSEDDVEDFHDRPAMLNMKDLLTPSLDE